MKFHCLYSPILVILIIWVATSGRKVLAQDSRTPVLQGQEQADENLFESLRAVGRDDPWTSLLPLTAVHTTYNEAGDTVSSLVVFMFSPTDEMEPVVLPVAQGLELQLKIGDFSMLPFSLFPTASLRSA